jgi:hypothetical protein
MSKLIPATLLAALLACSGKPTWTEYKSGPVTMQFPCTPTTSASVTKCVRSDGTEFSLAVVKKDIPDQEELQQSKEYAEGIPNAQVLKADAFPVQWRESRRTGTIDAVLYYKGGVEYVVSVTYSSEQPPPIDAEFLGKVKVE